MIKYEGTNVVTCSLSASVTRLEDIAIVGTEIRPHDIIEREGLGEDVDARVVRGIGTILRLEDDKRYIVVSINPTIYREILADNTLGQPTARPSGSGSIPRFIHGPGSRITTKDGTILFEVIGNEWVEVTSTSTTTSSTTTTTLPAAPPTLTIINRVNNEIPYNEPNTPRAVSRIYLHHTGDDAASKTIAEFKSTLDTGPDQKSSHYVIDRDGKIYQLVDENNVAYHARGFNVYSIGIEIVNTGHESMKYTPEQYTSIEALGREIADRWNFGYDNTHVKAHFQTGDPDKWDPSPNFDWNRIHLNGHPTLASLGRSPPGGMGYA